MGKLSLQQQRRVEEQKISSLSSLDLAALLRILDQNWYEISQKKSPSYEARHFLKEMQTVRNRWAHAGNEGFAIDDTYQDLDTLQRFSRTIEADEFFIQEIQFAKTTLLNTLSAQKEKEEANDDKANGAPTPVKYCLTFLEHVLIMNTNVGSDVPRGGVVRKATWPELGENLGGRA